MDIECIKVTLVQESSTVVLADVIEVRNLVRYTFSEAQLDSTHLPSSGQVWTRIYPE